MYPHNNSQLTPLLFFVSIAVLAIYVPLYSKAQTTDFVTTWKTSNTSTGSSLTKQIKIPINAGFTYKYNVIWGDGNTNNNVTTAITHSYTTAGTYTVRISGTFPAIYFNGAGDILKLLTVQQWGTTMAWQSFASAFYGCVNLNVTASDAPVLTGVTIMASMFDSCRSLTGNSIFNSWNTATVTDMSDMFHGAKLFNQNLASWNTASVKDMGDMFYGAAAFNQNIGGWSTGAVTNMAGIFYQAKAFNQNIGSWNTAAVTSMNSAFAFASAFNQNIGSWNTAAVKDMSFMFDSAIAFNQNIGAWNTNAVTNMRGVFLNATAFNQNIGGWNTAAVTDMKLMFALAPAFNQDISGWNTGAVTDMSFMFDSAVAFNQNIGIWNTGAVTDMSLMFPLAYAFNQSLAGFNISNVTTMADMLDYSGLSVTNYDNTIIGWQASAHKNNVTLNALGLYYCNSAVQHAALIANSGWTIIDEGQVSPPTPSISLTCGSGGGPEGNQAYGRLYEGSGQATSWLWTTTSGGRFYTSASLSVNSDSTTSHIQAPFVNLRGSYTVTIIAANGCGNSATYTITNGSCSPVLSSKMADFSAVQQTGGVLLSWQAAAGNGTGYFLVQRSNNATDWQQIGQVNQSGGTAGFSNYQFVDALPFPGTNYYRIQSVNRNTAPEITPVQQVYMPLNATVKLYPNPTRGPLVLEFFSSTASQAKICITNVAGKPIFTVLKTVSRGFNRLPITQLPALESGLYFVNLTYANGSANAKFLKL